MTEAPNDIVTIDVRSATRQEMIDITGPIRAAIKRSGATSGLACIFCPHTTAAVTIQENADPDVKSDMLQHLSKLIPKEAGFKHGEGNADAHIKASVIGPSVTVIVADGRPVLGTWQAIFFCEFDGPRERRVMVRVLGDHR
jgi:secondary thiamine-phosphate synthase enzyme